MELANIINSKMYGAEIHHRERYAMIYGREIARNLIELLFSHYDLVDEKNQVLDAMTCLVQPYLAQQAKCLIVYKAEAVRRDIHSDGGECTYEAVLHALQSYCVDNTGFVDIFNSCQTFQSFAWAGDTWSVRRKSKPTAIECKWKSYTSKLNLLNTTLTGKTGHTFQDKVWLNVNVGDEHSLPELVLPELDENSCGTWMQENPDEGDAHCPESDGSDSDIEQHKSLVDDQTK